MCLILSLFSKVLKYLLNSYLLLRLEHVLKDKPLLKYFAELEPKL